MNVFSHNVIESPSLTPGQFARRKGQEWRQLSSRLEQTQTCFLWCDAKQGSFLLWHEVTDATDFDMSRLTLSALLLSCALTPTAHCARARGSTKKTALPSSPPSHSLSSHTLWLASLVLCGKRSHVHQVSPHQRRARC